MFSIAGGVFGQGSFQNLDFEAVNISPPNQNAFFPFSEVFPGWIGYIGTNQATQAFYNGVSLGAALSSVFNRSTGYSNWVISGNFTAAIAAGQDQIINNSSEIVSAAIAQTGPVPPSALSVRFRVGTASRVSDLRVTFNGQIIPIFPLASGSNFDVYGGDISAFAGLPGELRFTSHPISSPLSKTYLDNIFFSDQSIPEPSGIGVFALGTLLVSWRLARFKR